MNGTVFAGVMHNSLRLCYRAPFGAVPQGARVRLGIDAPDGMEVRLLLFEGGRETLLTGERRAGGVRFTFTPERTGLIWYCFRLEQNGETAYYGASSGAGAVYGDRPPAYQITVYEPDFDTPRWFGEGVVYQIFPDRFARGSGRGGLLRAPSHELLGRRVIAHEDWNEPVLFRPLEGEAAYDPCDFYGGDLDGIRLKLPYLKSLGVSCIYLNPIFESPSNHRYDVSNHLRVDPMLGGEDALRRLVEAAKGYGVRIMLDGVFSHTGDDSVYFDRYGRYGGNGAYCSKDSPYYAWYDFSKWPDEYRCWWGFKTLPEVNELNPGYMEHIGRVLEHYAKLGIHSWRLDVADELPDAFIAFLRGRIKANDPDGVLLGEVWEDCSSKEGCGCRRRYVDGGELDGAMNYPFRNALVDFLLFRTDAFGLYARLMAQRENYPPPFYRACLNLLGSHDTVRIATVLSGAPGRDDLSREEQAAYAPADRDAQLGLRRLMLAGMIQFAMPGVPGIYYGDEIAMAGMADPFNRAPYPWGGGDAAMLAHFRALAWARRNSRALADGAFGIAALGPDVIALLRSGRDGSSALVAVNRKDAPVRVALCLEDFDSGPDVAALEMGARYRDILRGEPVRAEGGVIHLDLGPLSGVFLLNH